jgi:hypothetical protein
LIQRFLKNLYRSRGSPGVEVENSDAEKKESVPDPLIEERTQGKNYPETVNTKG